MNIRGGNEVDRVLDRPSVEPDWAAIDALTDDDIDRQIAADPDAAPDMGDVPLERWTAYRRRCKAST